MENDEIREVRHIEFVEKNGKNIRYVQTLNILPPKTEKDYITSMIPANGYIVIFAMDESPYFFKDKVIAWGIVHRYYSDYKEGATEDWYVSALVLDMKLGCLITIEDHGNTCMGVCEENDEELINSLKLDAVKIMQKIEEKRIEKNK